MEEKKTNIYTKLCVWDFDGTLCDSPLPEIGKLIWKEKTGEDWKHIGWWSKADSLSMDVFNIPTIPTVIGDYLKIKDDNNILHIMLTGRRDTKELKKAVKAILDSHGLIFDMYLHNNGGETGENKMKQIKDILLQYPTIKEILLWDDRDEHIPRFEAFGEQLIKDGLIEKFNLTHVLGEHHGQTP